MIGIILKIYSYKLPLIRSLNLKGNEVAFREGLILTLWENNELLASGEIAPLPGFSRETIEQAEEQLKRYVKSQSFDQVIFSLRALSDSRVKPDLQNHSLISFLCDNIKDAMLFPSVEFGICTTILNLLSKFPIRRVFSRNASDSIKVNALLSGSEDEVLERIRILKEKGFTIFKLKVGRQSLEEDIDLVHKVYENIEKLTKLVLDCNRSWSVKEAIIFGNGISDIKIMYIEEPIKDYLGILQLCNKNIFNIPIALDESLAMISPKAMEHIPGITTLILKPTILGFVKTIEFNKKAKSLGMKTVISSSFESSVGLMALAELASGLESSAGLDTIDWFAEDTLETSFEIKSGHVDLNTLPDQKLNLESSCIEEISFD